MMFKQILDDAVNALKTVALFTDPDNQVMRGEVGKINIVKRDAAIIMPEFKPPQAFGNDEPLPKQIPFAPNLFIICAGRKTLVECEDDVMELMIECVQKIHATTFNVDQSGNFKYCNLEMTDIEWTERSASLCVITVEFTVKLQI